MIHLNKIWYRSGRKSKRTRKWIRLSDVIPKIRNVIRILSRKTKNNPVLIGEPGVGKTAVVEGLHSVSCAVMYRKA